jgi:hypothetical protein
MARFTFNLILLAALLIAAKGFACEYPMKVENGTDCKGYLLNSEQFIESGNNKKQIRLKDLKIAELETLDELHEARHGIYKKELKTAKNRLKWYEIKSSVGYVISFSFGALLTGYVIKESIK